MHVIIAVKYKGHNPAPELAYVLNEITEKVTERGLAAGEWVLNGIAGNVIGKMFIEDTVGFLSDEAFNGLANAIGRRGKRSDAS